MPDTFKHADELIKWFWLESEGEMPLLTDTDELWGLGQINSEQVIERSNNPTRMRVFLIVGVFIDEMMYKHFRHQYDSFRKRFLYPKLHAEGRGGFAGPSWFLASQHGYDRKMRWMGAPLVVEVLMGDLMKWLNKQSSWDRNIDRFKEIVHSELAREFEADAARWLYALMLETINDAARDSGQAILFDG